MGKVLKLITLLHLMVAAHGHGANDGGAVDPPKCRSAACARGALLDATSLIQSSMLLHGAAPRNMQVPGEAPGIGGGTPGADHSFQMPSNGAPLGTASGLEPTNAGATGPSSTSTQGSTEDPPQEALHSFAWEIAADVDKADAEAKANAERIVAKEPKNPFSIGLPQKDISRIQLEEHQAFPIHERIEMELQGKGRFAYMRGKPREDLHKHVEIMDIDGQMLDVHEVLRDPTNTTSFSESQFPVALAFMERTHPVSTKGEVNWNAIFDENQKNAEEELKKCNEELDNLKLLWKDETYRKIVKKKRKIFEVTAEMYEAQFKAERKRRKQLYEGQIKAIKAHTFKTGSGEEFTAEDTQKMVDFGEQEMESLMHRLIGQRDRMIQNAEKDDRKWQYKQKVEECSKAASNVKWLPRIRKRMVGAIEESGPMSNLMEEIFDWFGHSKKEKSLVPGEITADLGAKLVMDAAVAKTYWSLRVRNALQKMFRVLRGALMAFIIHAMDGVKELVLEPVLLAVGSLPFAGGFLSVTCSILINAAFEFVNHIIEIVIDNTLDFLLDTVAKVIYTPIVTLFLKMTNSEDRLHKFHTPTEEELLRLADAKKDEIKNEKDAQWKGDLQRGGGVRNNDAIIDVATAQNEKFKEEASEEHDEDEGFGLPGGTSTGEPISEVGQKVKETWDRLSTWHSEGLDPRTQRICWTVLGAVDRDDSKNKGFPNCKCGGQFSKYWSFKVKCGDAVLYEDDDVKDGHRLKWNMETDITPKLGQCAGLVPACIAELKSCAQTDPDSCKGSGWR